MPVEVSLELLVSLPGTKPVWPEQFRDLVETIEESFDERTRWVTAADWCGDHEEHGLARAFAWVAKRRHIEVRNASPHTRHWLIDGLPAAVTAEYVPSTDKSTLAGAIAELAARLRKLDEVIA